MKKNDTHYYFGRYLAVAPFALALWRGTEAQAIADGIHETQRKSTQKKGDVLHLNNPVLDIGCGFGEFAGVFFDSQVEMGIDINAKDLLIAAKCKKYKKLICADARKLPFKNNSFKTVISMSVLEHIPQTEKAIAEAYRVLKPRGLFIFTVPTTELNNYLFFPTLLKLFNFSDAAAGYTKKFHQVFKHESLFSVEKWQRIMRNNKFKILHLRGTIAPRQILFFDLFLISAFPSQILRWLFGKRFAWGLQFKRPLLEPLYSALTSPDHKSMGNIVIIAQKL